MISLFLASVLGSVAPQLAQASVTPVPLVQPTLTPNPIPSPNELLFRIRKRYRSRRPPPPFVTYTLVRSHQAYGFRDEVNSYTWRVWCRTSDRAALEREESRLGAHGPLTFKRPSFNIADDPGPPVADLFEKAPARAPVISEVPTPEPLISLPPTIASVSVLGEFDYNVVSAAIESGLLHVVLAPRRDPERNRLRELFVDPRTYELRKLITHDRIFFPGGDNYPLTFTISLGEVQNYPVMTKIHSEVVGDYPYDDRVDDFEFDDIVFPMTLPDWYFDPKTYRSHVGDAPL